MNNSSYQIHAPYKKHPGCIVIVTVTKIEAQAVLKVFSKNNNIEINRQIIGGKTYCELGTCGGTTVYMVQSEMGSATPNGALLTVTKAIHDLQPQAIIMCGIAFGLKKDRQKLGDILVARQILCYESQKVDIHKGQIPRGDRVTSSERLLDRFRSGDNDWNGAKTHFGLILSGEKLVNNSSFKDRLLEIEPEAIGGEMEGAGLYIAAREAKKDWILVKAICDWGDGKKRDDKQELAAENAARFVLHVLQQGGFSEDEPFQLDSNKMVLINDHLRNSRERCIARWQSAGVSLEKAKELYDDESVGKPSISLIDTLSSHQMIVLTGSFGSGKSLIGERILQKSIKKLLEDSSAPIPVYIKAQEIKNDLEKVVIKKTDGLGNPRRQGAVVLIDSADEAGLSASWEILNEARILRSWPNTSIIITSRPWPIYENIEEKLEINKLEENEIIDLVSRINGIKYDRRILYGVPKPIRDAISSPFFALLWARYLPQSDQRRVKTTGELINYFLDDIIRKSSINKSEVWCILEKLSSKSIDRDGEYIPFREICDDEEINMLLETRLIEKVDEKIGFPLPIFTQWFAALSLKKELVDIFEIANDFSRMEKWRYPLIIVASLFSHEDVTRIISPIIENNPGFAAEIINAGISVFGCENNLLLPSARECGMKIRQVYTTWISGVGDIAKYIAPINSRGKLIPTGVSVNGKILEVAWYSGEDEINEIIELPVRSIFHPNLYPKWSAFESFTVGSHLAWAWKWCLDNLTQELNKSISKKDFFLNNGHIEKEILWIFALKFMKNGPLYDKQILINKLEQNYQNHVNIVGTDKYTPWFEACIQNIKGTGDEYLRYPWPSSDVNTKNGDDILDAFSDNQKLYRTIAVYKAALEEYENLINSIFIKFKPKMLIGTLLPVKLHGQIIINASYRFEWYLEPLPMGSENQVEITLNNDLIIRNDVFEFLNQKILETRPFAKEWLYPSVHGGGLISCNSSPVTNIVYSWLKSDLQRIKWL